ncbi:hypothetical protein AB0F72_26500 [Actinoplanes sp. NPDC023936]|uniref:hypothetical protein n=1 Tax=Actinoplanes sp. NPDC023936 TaxID=3154910 RepID=UPI0033C95201
MTNILRVELPARHAATSSSITNTAVSGMPRAQAGVAAAIASTSRQVGSALGVAVIGAVVASGGTPTGGHAGWWILCGLGLAVLALGRFSTGRWAQATKERGYAESVPA